MESISQAVERPPQSQIEGVPSDESRQFIAKPPGGPGGSQSGHQRKRDFRKRYWRSVPRGQNPSLVGQSGSKGRSQRCLESCTNFCRRMVSFLVLMVTWAQLKTIAVMIQLLTLTRTAFNHCKRMVIWAQSKTMAVMIQLLTLARTTFYLCKWMITWTQLKTIAVMIQLLTFARTMLCQAQAKLMTLIKFFSSIFDIGTDILQGKGTFKNYTCVFSRFFYLIL